MAQDGKKSQNTFSKIKDSANKSISWFWDKVKELSTGHNQHIKAPALISSRKYGSARSLSTILPGELCLFAYDPKHKQTLPYYDIYPLIFPIDMNSKTFLGLNMHYLPYEQRMLLLSKLLQFQVKDTTGKVDNRRLKISWDILNASANLKAFQPCVHRYLTSNLKSMIKVLDTDEWERVLLLPIHNFQSKDGISAEAVWAESMKKIQKR